MVSSVRAANSVSLAAATTTGQLGTLDAGLVVKDLPATAFKVCHPRNRHDFKLAVSQAALEAVRRKLTA